MKCWKVVRDCGGKRWSAITESGFKLEYPKGEVVEAYPGTLGIFCFRDVEVAQSFVAANVCTAKRQILCVRGIGASSVPEVVCAGSSKMPLLTFYDHPALAYKAPPPAGTVCFQKVEVLT